MSTIIKIRPFEGNSMSVARVDQTDVEYNDGKRPYGWLLWQIYGCILEISLGENAEAGMRDLIQSLNDGLESFLKERREKGVTRDEQE